MGISLGYDSEIFNDGKAERIEFVISPSHFRGVQKYSGHIRLQRGLYKCSAKQFIYMTEDNIQN